MAARQNPETPAEEPGFEAALERLETIVEELEGGQLTLEQSLRHYEEGMALSRRLARRLDEAEKTIERLVESDDEGGDEPGGAEEAEGGAGGPATPQPPRKAKPPGTRPMTLELGGANDELPF
uniref:Exodeoxyribonuclease 7 small subunit n=1 Tax=Eiseniibacteriota bacterium TaxID=2212470 RepID=A0A832MIG9_UNCEI